MAKAETTFQNAASGELSPKLRGRYELPVVRSGMEIARNFIAEAQGPWRFRNGFKFTRTTRRNKLAWGIKFQFSNQQAYVLEFTDGYMRVHKDNGVVTETAKNITGATKANPCQITSNSHGFSNGDEVYITGVVGMTELNGKFFIVAGAAANTFTLTDQDGNNVNSTGYTTYVSGGTVARVYEITTPYLETDDLSKLRLAQNADICKVVHPYYEPRNLTRSGHASWALALFSRTNDPFLDKKTISAATQANPCQVTAVGHGYSTGDKIIIETVVGMTQLNGRWYTITKIDADNFTLDGVNSTGYTAYSSAGYASKRNLLPASVTFYEGRCGYAAIEADPLGFKLSRSPDNNGAARYDDFTNGTDDDHAIENTINAEDESAIAWIRGNDKFLAIGAYSGIYKVTGNQDDEAISPTSIKARRVSAVGTSTVNPVSLENAIIYAERQNLTLRSFEFDALLDSFVANDRNLLAEHILATGIKQFAWVSGRPDVAYTIRTDGLLVGMTFKSAENISGWHRHPMRTTDEVFSIVSVPRSDNYDRLWAFVKRTVNGSTRRYVEYLEDPTQLPEPVEFFSGEENETDDTTKYQRALYEATKRVFHVDSGLTYDGSDTSIASQTMTPGAVSGLGVTFTAGGAIFKSTDVGREIRKKPSSAGVGTGRAVIVEYVNTTTVKCNISEAFDTTTAMAAGNWFFTTASLSGFDHLEGISIRLVADGAAHANKTVTAGAVTLDYQASVVHGGIGYTGILKSMNIEAGGITGPAQTKPKQVKQVGFRFFQTAGTKFGTALYKLKQINFRGGKDVTDRPAPLFSGDRLENIEDGTANEKYVYVVQNVGLPCNVQLIMPYMETKN